MTWLGWHDWCSHLKAWITSGILRSLYIQESCFVFKNSLSLKVLKSKLLMSRPTHIIETKLWHFVGKVKPIASPHISIDILKICIWTKCKYLISFNSKKMQNPISLSIASTVSLDSEIVDITFHDFLVSADKVWINHPTFTSSSYFYLQVAISV